MALISAAVLGPSIQDVECHEAKVVGSAEPVALRDGLPIARPFNLRLKEKMASYASTFTYMEKLYFFLTATKKIAIDSQNG